MPDIFTVGECCPLGCLAVILVKRSTDQKVFAWCGTCGLAWAEPVAESWRLGDYGEAELHAAIIADGSMIELASWEDIKKAGLEHITRPAEPMKDWPEYLIRRYNDTYGL
jgi:hypothetical protein